MQYVKFVVLGLLALVAFKVAFSLMGDMSGSEQSGTVIVEPRIVNMGNVVLNQGTGFSASMRNNGHKPVKIAKIERSCGCISVYLSKDTCQPGETVAVSGTLTPLKQGRFRYVVKLIEEDNSAPEHVIEVEGKADAGSGTVSQSGSSNP